MEKIYSQPIKPKGAVRVLHFADIHLNHPRVPSYHIGNNIQNILTLYKNTVDVIYIDGDLWDDSKHLHKKDTKDAVCIIVWLIQFCVKNNIALRILNGTASHDNNQSDILPIIGEYLGSDDIRYFDGIGIFKDERLGKTVGWVEDNHSITAKETEDKFKEYMLTHGYDKVDIMSMHGFFRFQIPVESKHAFSESFWTNLTRLAIYIGHDHIHKSFKNIHVVGSFDRLSQNEEEDKGFIVADYVGDLVKHYHHINTNACIQLTVRNSEYDFQYKECLTALERIMGSSNPNIARLNIEYSDGSPILSNITEWKKQYPCFIKPVKIKDDIDVRVFESFKTVNEIETITSDNVGRILLEELVESDINTDIINKIIDEVK